MAYQPPGVPHYNGPSHFGEPPSAPNAMQGPYFPQAGFSHPSGLHRQMGYQSAPSANPAPNPGYNYRGEGNYPQYTQPTSPHFGESQGNLYFRADRQPYQQSYQPGEHQLPDYQSPHAWEAPSQPSIPSHLQSQPSNPSYLQSQPSMPAPDYSHPFAVNLNPLFGNAHSAGVMQSPASPRLNPLYVSPDQHTLVTPGQFFLTQSQTPFLTQSQNLGRQQTLPSILTRPSTGVLPSYLGSRTGSARNPRSNQMGIELGRVGSADMAKSTVMMQLLAAHHEALGQRDAVSARHEELERRHYELMKAQARLEVEREGGGSPRRNRGGEREELETGGQGGSGSDTVLHKIETMVEGLHKKIEEHGKILTRTGKGSGEEKQTNDLEAMAKHEDRLSALEQRLATALPGAPQSSSPHPSFQQDPAAAQQRPQLSNDSMLITVPKLPTIHTPARIPQAEPSQAHEPQTLPSTRSPPHEGGPENLRREPPENEAGVSPHEDASILEPAQQEFLGGLVIAPGGCREAQDEGYAALYYVYMAFLLGLAAYCMVFAGALKGAHTDHPGAWYREAGYMLASAAGEALLLVAFLLALARAYHGAVVMVVVIVPSLLSALGAGVLLSREMWVPGGLMCGVLLATLLGIFLARKGLSFAGATSGFAFDAMRERWGTIIFCVFTSILQGVATLCLLIEVVICVRGLGWAATIPYILGYLWTLSVAANNVRFVVGGSVAAWCSAEPLVNLAQPTRGRERDAANRVAPASPQQSPRFRDPHAGAGFGGNPSGLAEVSGANVGVKPEGEAPRVQGWAEAKGLEVSAARPRRKVAGTPSFVKWAIMKSAGSVCGGVIVDVIVWLVDWAVYILGFLCCCCTFCCGDSSAFHMRDWAKERSNRFGLVRCGMRGRPYVQSSKDAWRFVKASASHAMADDDVMHHVVFLGSLFGALFPGCLTALWARSNHGGDNELVIFAFIAGSLLGYAIVQPLFHALSAAAAAILLCAMEDPLQLERNRNPLCAELKAAWSKTWGRTPWDDLILSTRVAAASRAPGAIANPWAVTEIWGADHVAQGEGVHVAPGEGSDGGSPHPGALPGMVSDNEKLVVYEPAAFPVHPPAYPEPPESFRTLVTKEHGEASVRNNQGRLGEPSSSDAVYYEPATFPAHPPAYPQPPASFQTLQSQIELNHNTETGKHGDTSTNGNQGGLGETSSTKAVPMSPSKQELETRRPANESSSQARSESAHESGPDRTGSPAEGTVSHGSVRLQGSGGGEDILARTIGKVKGDAYKDEEVSGSLKGGVQLPTESSAGMPERRVAKAPEKYVIEQEWFPSSAVAEYLESKGIWPKAQVSGSAERDGNGGPVPSGTTTASVPSGSIATEKAEPRGAEGKGATGGTWGPQTIGTVPVGAIATERTEPRGAEAKEPTTGTTRGPNADPKTPVPLGASATEKSEAATGGSVRGPQNVGTAGASVPSGANATGKSDPRGAEAKGPTAGTVWGPDTDRKAPVPLGSSTTEKAEPQRAEAKGASGGTVQRPETDRKAPTVTGGSAGGTAERGGQSLTEPGGSGKSGTEPGQTTGKRVPVGTEVEVRGIGEKSGGDKKSASGAQSEIQTGSGTTSSGGLSGSNRIAGEGPSNVSGKDGAKIGAFLKAGSTEKEPERNAGKGSGSGKIGGTDAPPVSGPGTGGSTFKVTDALKSERVGEEQSKGGGVDQARKSGTGSADSGPSAGLKPLSGTENKSSDKGTPGFVGGKTTVMEAQNVGPGSKIKDDESSGKHSLQMGPSKVEEPPRKDVPVSKAGEVTGLSKEDEMPRGKLPGRMEEPTPQGTRVKLADLQPVRPKGVPLETGGSGSGSVQDAPQNKDAVPAKSLSGAMEGTPRASGK